MLEEPAMFKPLSYSSEFVSIRQPFVLSTDNASFKAKNIRAGSPDKQVGNSYGACANFSLQTPANYRANSIWRSTKGVFL